MSNFGYPKKYTRNDTIGCNTMVTRDLVAQGAVLPREGSMSSVVTRVFLGPETSFNLTTEETLSSLLILQIGWEWWKSATAQLPSAADLVAALPGVQAGNTWRMRIKVVAGITYNTPVLTLGTDATGIQLAEDPSTIGVSDWTKTVDDTRVPACGGGVFLLEFTNVTPGSEEVVVHSMGTYLDKGASLTYRLVTFV